MFKNVLLNISLIEQIIKFHTKENNILDLILTNNSELFSNINFCLPFGESDHLIIVGNLLTVRPLSNLKNSIVNNFKYAPYYVISIFVKNNLKLLNLSDNVDEIDVL